METVDAIAETKTDWGDRPYEDQVMKNVTVETFGVEYAEPKKA
jgi:peptidyl-prolyl cis-trans isomerase B (cyclophilin B)